MYIFALLQLHWVERPELLYPLLKIEIGKATQSCDGAQLDNYAEAIISQVEMAMESKFSDNFGHPEQMVVIANCQGASSMQVRLRSCSLKQIMPLMSCTQVP